MPSYCPLNPFHDGGLHQGEDCLIEAKQTCDHNIKYWGYSMLILPDWQCQLVHLNWYIMKLNGICLQNHMESIVERKEKYKGYWSKRSKRFYLSSMKWDSEIGPIQMIMQEFAPHGVQRLHKYPDSATNHFVKGFPKWKLSPASNGFTICCASDSAGRNCIKYFRSLSDR